MPTPTDNYSALFVARYDPRSGYKIGDHPAFVALFGPSRQMPARQPADDAAAREEANRQLRAHDYQPSRKKQRKGS